MKFNINQKPPTSEEILVEQQRIGEATRVIQTRDMIITFILVLICSIGIGAAVYWSTASFKYAAIAFSIFPALAVILSFAGLISMLGFRSNAMRIIELKNEHISLLPISSESEESIQGLCKKYPQVRNYTEQVERMGRALVNAELGMFWEWDATTQAKHAKQQAYLDSAAGSRTDNGDGGANVAGISAA